jgi:hypothetical protein
VVVELGTGVDIGLVDAVEHELADTDALLVDQGGVEHALGSLESLGTDADDATVGQSVLLDERGGLEGQALLELEVVADIAEL